MACAWDRGIDPSTAYEVVLPWHKSRQHGPEAQAWLMGDEAVGQYESMRVSLPTGEEGVVMFFTDLATATAFKLKFG